MKSLIFTILCLLIFIQPNAQQHAPIAPRTDKKGKGEWLKYKSAEQAPVADLVQNKTALRLGSNDGLTFIKTIQSTSTTRHHRYQQTYGGVPIDGAIFTFHEKDNLVKNANGGLIRGLNISTTPAISEAAALQAALLYTDAAQYAWESELYEDLAKQIEQDPNATLYPEGELFIVDTGRKQQTADYRLAYKFDIFAIEPQSREYVYVDAQNGEVLMTESRMHSCTDVEASGTTNYSGNQNFTVCHDSENARYILRNNIGGTGMQVFDAANSNGSPQIAFIDDNVDFDGDPTANEVHWAAEKIREYFLTAHQRNSFDNIGMPICSWIRYERTPGNGNNAYWNGMFMQFGDGDGETYSSLTSPDIIGHEFAHGVTDFTAQLKSSGESGALNESFSDIFGEVAEWYMRGSNDWIIGADFVISPNFEGIRSMSDPKNALMRRPQPDTHLGTHWYSGNEGSAEWRYTNCSIQNYWFYLLVEGGSGTNDNNHDYDIMGIGMEKAAAVAYLNLTAYLWSTATYADARAGAIQVAQDLEQDGVLTASDVQQVEAAWDAVGVTSTTDSGSNPAEVELDYIALRALYLSTNGDNWTDNSGWPTAAEFNLNPTMPQGTDMSTWNGVTLNNDGRVYNLRLLGNRLSGSLPPEIGNLTNLRELVFRFNSLNGSLPPEIGNLTNLIILNLSLNYLSGSLPPEIWNLTNLKYLDFYENDLSGNIPPEIGNLINLTKLDFYKNDLSGNIPPEIGNLNSLKYLDFYDNDLSGNIPSEIGNLTNLTELSLFNNDLSGNIPSEIGNLTNLKYLLLGQNQLSGSIPPEIGNLSYLTHLNLRNNQLSGCYDVNLLNLAAGSNASVSDGNDFNAPWEAFRHSLNGTGSCSVPSYGNCHESDSLALVDLYNSTDIIGFVNMWDLSQPMHTWSGVSVNGFGCVIHLDIRYRQLSGSIPPEIGNLTNLTYLSFWNNDLSGNIPPEIGNLTNLTYLSLFDNYLSGGIPPEIGNLTNLKYLSLSYNELSGNIPSEIGNLNNLEELYLYSNKLEGCYDYNLQGLCDQLTEVTINYSNNFIISWGDFCNANMGICYYDTVWPGDFNEDGIVNVTDLIYWGVAEGNIGFSRPSATTEWAAQVAYEWQSAHQDGNGDGVVDAADIDVFIQHYGRTRLDNLRSESYESLINYELRYHDSDTDNNKIFYRLYVISKTGGIPSVHGLSGKIDCSGIPLK